MGFLGLWLADISAVGRLLSILILGQWLLEASAIGNMACVAV